MVRHPRPAEEFAVGRGSSSVRATVSLVAVSRLVRQAWRPAFNSTASMVKQPDAQRSHARAPAASNAALRLRMQCVDPAQTGV